jgi:hypothetical protein
MKRLFLAAVLIFAAIGITYAAQTDTVAITVSISGTGKSVDIKETATTANVAINSSVTLASMTVTNTSGGLTEDYQIKASTGNNNWTLSNDGSVGVNKACIQAVVKVDGSTAATFGTEDSVSFAYQDCSTTKFGDSATCGAGVLYTAPVRSLLVKILAPTSVTQTSEVITLTFNVK